MLGTAEALEIDHLADDFQTRCEESPTPEQDLLRAILHRSILDLTDSSKEVRRDARAFFLKPSESPWEPFSFQWIAEYLSIDFKAVVKRIEALGLLSEKTKNPSFRSQVKTRGKRVR